MTALQSSDWVLILGSFALGIVAGLVVASLLARKLKYRLAAAEFQLAQRTELAAEREKVFELAAERLGQTFDQLAQAQFRNHSETFLRLARENLGTQHAAYLDPYWKPNEGWCGSMMTED